MKSVKGKHILIGVTGGIAAYKTAYIISELVNLGADVRVVMTENAKKFVGPLTFQTLSKNKVYDDMFDISEYHIRHISLVEWADVIVIIPATANIIGKVASGIADDLLSTVIMTVKATPVIFAPAMNEGMWKDVIVQGNIRKLKKAGYKIIIPEMGKLACGTVGFGRLAKEEKIIKGILTYI